MKITKAQVDAMEDRMQSLGAALVRARSALADKKQELQAAHAQAVEGTRSVLMKVVRSGEVVGVAGMFGLVNGRTGGLELLGVPVDLLSGAALHGAGVAGLAGDQSDHLHAMGDGALASFSVTLGTSVGARMRREALAAAAARASGGGGGAAAGALPGADAADRAMANALAHMAR